MHSSKPTKQDVEFFMLNHGSLTHYKGSSIFLLPGRGFGSCCQGGLSMQFFIDKGFYKSQINRISKAEFFNTLTNRIQTHKIVLSFYIYKFS